MFEPITGAAGACLTPSDDYWRAVADVCRRHGILLIADEVMTGFGRTGLRWGHQHFPIAPDIIYGGKGLGGGYVPIGMVAATDEIVADAARRAGSCSSRSPAMTRCAPARPPCSRSSSPSTSSSAARRWATLLAERLADALGGHPDVVEIRGRGLFRGIELTPAAAAAFAAGGRRRVPRPRHVDLPGRLRRRCPTR